MKAMLRNLLVRLVCELKELSGSFVSACADFGSLFN